MSAFQQALLHTVLLIVGVIAVAVLAATNNLSTEALSAVLGLEGIGNVGVAAVTPTGQAVAVAPGKPVAPVPPVVQ